MHCCFANMHIYVSVLGPMELELLTVVSCLLCMLRMDLGPLQEQYMSFSLAPPLQPQHISF